MGAPTPRRAAIAHRRALGALVTVLVLAAGCRRTADAVAPATSAPAPPSTVVGVGAGAGPSGTMPATTITLAPVVPDAAYASAIGDVVVDNAALDPLERELVRRVQQAGLRGASLLVVHRGRLVELEAWLGYDLTTQVPIASASKWLTAATVLTVVDEGLLSLDEPIATHLPKAKGTSVGAITLRQLLSFTSGLVDSDRLPAVVDPDITLLDAARAVLAEGLVHPPGAAFRYGGQHLLVAAALAEVVTGRRFVDLFHERIAQPLGMTDTVFAQVGDNRLTDVDHPGPSGTALSTLRDYGRFLEMLVHDGLAPSGRRILRASSVTAMQTNHTEDVRYGTAAEARRTARTPYGFGEWIDWTFPDGSAMVVSSEGAFGFRPWIDHRNGIFGVYLVNDLDHEGATVERAEAIGGSWIFTRVAAALGGDLPAQPYPHR